MQGFGDSSNNWQGPPVEFNAGSGFPCGSSASGLGPAVSGVSGVNGSGAQSAPRRPSVTGGVIPGPMPKTGSMEFTAGTVDDKSGIAPGNNSGDGEVSEVFMDELIGVPQANVEQHQTMYVHYDGISSGQISTTWSQQDAIKAQQSKSAGSDAASQFGDMPLTCSLKIVQAPAAFARPMVQKKAFRPPFKLRLEMTYKGKLDFPVSMGAFPLSDSQYTKPGSLKPSAALNNQEVESCIVNKQITSPANAEKSMDSDMVGEENTMSEDFEFTDLKFVKSSRMSKRWLLFAFKIKEDYIYCIFDLPSVIVSRKTDQFSKAYATLTGGPPPMKRTRVPGPSMSGTSQSGMRGGAKLNVAMMKVDADQARQWIISKYCEFLPNTMRQLSDHDLMWLLQKAGLNPGMSEVMMPGSKWQQFEEWYLKCLSTLQSVEATWDQTDPEIICGFYMDRRRAEQLLQQQPAGTFLVRMCSEPGCFAVSSRTKFRDPFNHLLLDRVDLQRRRLMLWIQAHDAAQMLVNTRTGQKIPKDSVMDTGFYKMPNFSDQQSVGNASPYLDTSTASGMSMGMGGMTTSQGISMNPSGGGGQGMMGSGQMFNMGQSGSSHRMLNESSYRAPDVSTPPPPQGHDQQMEIGQGLNLMDAPLSLPDAEAWASFDTDFGGGGMNMGMMQQGHGNNHQHQGNNNHNMGVRQAF